MQKLDPEMMKKGYEHLCNLLTDQKAFDEMLDKSFETVQKAKAGTLTIEELQKGMSEAMEAKGMKAPPMPREAVEKMFNEVTSDKTKAMTKEELSKKLREILEERKKKAEEMMKK
eukprot:TRINITY_DN0_c144_g1_i7.p1 TRINITY_DN0_c144_g1~~TRINITY_DN0_c144_g1_i7.p1  ORF type:complete len:115 (-),score=60.62 TRINITY_DN0_c144_g1_i7:65-409(-)